MAKFRTRARAIDMLGRQQIRGIPTAISELFKNAHDAYADEVRVDFLRNHDLLAIRDNGFGMSPSDFLDRWLTVGTDVKLSDQLPPPGRAGRALLGEKGIGRLAIAAVGPQTLVITRGEGAASGQVLISLVNWRVFEEPGINLDDIEIASTTILSGEAPTLADLSALREEAAGVIGRLGLPIDRIAALKAQVLEFPIEAINLASQLPGPSLGSGHSGTHFYISPVDPTLAQDISTGNDESAELIQDLVGFANPLLGTPAMSATFYDWTGPGQCVELIGPQQFWTSTDLADADHEVDGSFDEHGIFRGHVRVYDQDHEALMPPPGTPSQPTLCGPFAIRFGYVQGAQSESRLDPARWAQLSRKVAEIGGIYVYRDGIRILPYGRHDFDWLNIERNRSKGAAYYFFSYRRMFGYVSIDRASNSALAEKAGREGFRENPAYRQFRDILRNFFVQLAADFFRESGGQSAYYQGRKDQLRREDLARREREKRAGDERRRFVRELGRKLTELSGGVAGRQIDDVIRRADVVFGSARQADVVASAMENTLGRLDAVRRTYRLDLPGVGLAEDTRRDWEAYQGEWETLTTALAHAEAHVHGAAAAAIEAARRAETNGQGSELTPERTGETIEIQVDAEVVSQVIAQIKADARDRTEAASSRAVAAGRTVANTIQNVARELTESIESIETPADLMSAPDALGLYLAQYRALTDRNERLLNSLAAAAARVNVVRSDGEILSPGELDAAADQQIISLREQVERDLELAQLGLAVEVVSHEFNATVSAIRRNLRNLSAWSRRNPGLVPLYSELSAAFEHLDSYLTLFTPLQRRMQSEPTELSGGEIFRFISDLFDDRLSKESVALEASDAFRQYLFIGRPAVFYPVFVNLVDNAAFWLADRPGLRVIRLDLDANAMTVEDNGPGVARGDRPFIFEPGFTRKPGGRGLGLFISREVMKRNDYRLAVEESALGGAKFIIEPAPAEGPHDD
jgi:signal transduction histidine kinase